MRRDLCVIRFAPLRGSSLRIATMFRFHLLGGLDLRDAEGREVLSVLAQPKRTALLAFFAVSSRTGYQRRDSLLNLFWPESGSSHARDSLRQAVRYLRRSLGADVIVGRSDEELGIDPDRLWCDACAFEQALDAGETEQALELYRGDLLPGFFLSDVPGFEHWLERERARLRARAVEAAWTVAVQREERRDPDGAAAFARRAMDLCPDDEGTLRRLIALLDRLGDRASAVRAYEEFAHRLLQDCEAEPSAETRALVERVREREAPFVAEPTAGVADGRLHAAPPSLVEAVDPRTAMPSLEDLPAGPREAKPERLLRSRPKRAALAGGLFLLGTLGLGIASGLEGSRDEEADEVVVLPFENRSGDPSLDPLGRWAADWVGQGLTRIERVRVVNGSVGQPGSDTEELSGGRLGALLDEVGATTVVSGSYYRFGDSIQFQARIADADGVALVPSVGPVRGSLAQAQELVNLLSERVTGALAAHRNPRVQAANAAGSRPPSYEAYLVWVVVLELFGRKEDPAARERLIHAYALDYSFVTPLIWAAATHGNLLEYQQVDSLLRIAERGRQQMLPCDRHLLDLWKAHSRGDQVARYNAVRGMLDVAPASEIALFLMGGAAMAINKPGEAVRAIRNINVEGSGTDWDAYGTRLTHAYHLLGDHETERSEARRIRESRPELVQAIVDEVRALAALGEVGESLRLLDRALSLPRHPRVTPADAARIAAEEFRVHGNPGAADQALARALSWYRTRPAAERDTEAHRYGVARILYLAGRLDESERLFRELAERFPQNVDYLGYLGAVAGREGRAGEVERVSLELSRLDRPHLRGKNTYWRARIAAVAGRHDEALALLRASFTQGQEHGLAVHSEPDFESLRPNAAFRQLLQPKG